jgi:hypothetical protein
MTETELRELEGAPEVHTPTLFREIRRLRALVATAEWVTSSVDIGGSSEPTCPWCDQDEYDRKHRPNCPAFSAPGVLR